MNEPHAAIQKSRLYSICQKREKYRMRHCVCKDVEIHYELKRLPSAISTSCANYKKLIANGINFNYLNTKVWSDKNREIPEKWRK